MIHTPTTGSTTQPLVIDTNEQRAALLEDASEKLREASHALSDISDLVRDVPYADWNSEKSKRLPIGFMIWHLNFIADALEKQAWRAVCAEPRERGRA